MAVSEGVILLNQGIAASPFTSGSFTVANADATLIVLFQASFQADPTDIDLDGITPFTEVVLANYNGNMPLQAWVLTGVASGSHDLDVSGHGTGDNAGRLIAIEYADVHEVTPIGATDNPTSETEGYVAAHDFDLATALGDMVLAALFEIGSDGVTSGGDRVLYDGVMGYGEGQIEEYDGLAGTTNVNWAAHNVEFGSIGLVLQAAPEGGGGGLPIPVAMHSYRRRRAA